MVSRPASVVSRVAVILDHLAATFFSSLLILPTGFLLLRNGVSFPAVSLISTLILVLVTFGYFTLSEYRSGATFFKKLFGMEVVSDREDSDLKFWQAAVRNLLRIVDISTFYLTGFGMILTNPKNKRLGDIAAGTMVVTEGENGYDLETPSLGIKIVGYSLAVVGLFPMAGIFPALFSVA